MKVTVCVIELTGNILHEGFKYAKGTSVSYYEDSLFASLGLEWFLKGDNRGDFELHCKIEGSKLKFQVYNHKVNSGGLSSIYTKFDKIYFFGSFVCN